MVAVAKKDFSLEGNAAGNGCLTPRLTPNSYLPSREDGNVGFS